MKVKPIQTEEEYKAALKEVERLFDINDNTIEQEQMEELLNLIEAYEDKHYSIPQPNLAEKVSYFVESRRLFKK